MLREVQFDGLVGPTHSYAGLSRGNIASTSHGGRTSHPKAAALQGLAKMRLVHALGVDQAFLPPLERPDTALLRRAGFEGDDAAVLAAAATDAPHLLARTSSASSMWTANAATVTPSCDADDGHVHVTPANLLSMAHRAIEPPHTAGLLRAALPFAIHHDPLPPQPETADEGAANHTRLHTPQGAVHLFVWGVDPDDAAASQPQTFQARQSRRASATIAANHALPQQRTLLAQQHPAAIDAGVFHNDVISVGSGRLLLLHERAFLHTQELLDELTERLGGGFRALIVTEDELTVDDAVATYLFNSQLLDTQEGFVLICPAQAKSHPASRAILDGWVAAGEVARVEALDLHESMRNGGGPACLRLRVPLSESELANIHSGFRIDEPTLDRLEAWVERWYPESLTPGDLADPALLTTCRDALDELTTMQVMGNLYPFQQDRSS